MGEWSNLTQREKSNIIRFAIKNGVSDINQIRDTFNVYAKDSLANVDYNMAAAKASGFGSNGNGHYPDTFKRPNHPTFSDESIYHSEVTPGGRWRGNTYEPSEFVLNQQGGWNNFLKSFYSQEQGTGAVPVFNGGVMLPEATVTPQYKEGGSIPIKHPGRLTALKERTGKTEAELWATGNAHTRKMITFARNARKWKHSTGGPLYPFSFQKNPYWKTPVVRYAEGGDTNRELEFIPNENIQNVEVWLNKGTKLQKRRPGTVNLQNIVDALDPNGPDNQYVWDDAEHNSYSAFRRNPDYRAQIVPAINKGITPMGLNVSKYIEKAPSVHLSPEYILNNLPNFKISPVSVPLPKRNNQNLNGNWIPQESMWNPAYGYETFHLENSPYYGIKYYSIPGAVNAGQGSSAVLDSTVMGILIQELNSRIFDYRTQNGGWSSFNPPTN